MKAESAGRKVTRNSTILGLVFGFNSLAGTVTSILLAYLLTRDQLGIYGTWFRVFAWLGMLAAFLVPPVLVRYTAESIGAGQFSTVWKLLRASLGIETISLITLSIGYLAWRFATAGLADWGLVAIVLLASSLFAFGQVFDAFLRGWQRFDAIAVSTFVSTLARIALLAVLFLFGAGVATALLVYTVGLAVQLIVTLRYTRGLYSAHTAANRSDSSVPGDLKRRVVEYGGTMGVGGILSLGIWHYPEVFFLDWLWAGQPGREAELAWYTLAISLTALPLRLGKVLGSSLLPAFSEMYGTGDHERLRAGYHRATRVSAAAGLPVVAISIAAAPTVIPLVFPANLSQTILPFQLMMIPAFFLALHQAGSAMQPAIEGHRFHLATTAILAPMAIVLNFMLVPAFGAAGAGGVNAIAQSLAVLAGIYYLAIRRSFGFPGRPVTLLTVAALLAGCVVYTVSLLPVEDSFVRAGVLFLSCCLGGTVYIAAVRVFGALGVADVRALEYLSESLPSRAAGTVRWLAGFLVGGRT